MDFKTQIEGRLFQINQQMSTYLLHSEISRLNGGDVGTWYDVSPEFIRVYDLAKDIHRQTGGAFEPTLGELVNLWGFGPKGRVTKVPNDLDLQDALRNMGFQKIISADGKRLQKTNAKVYLDFSAIAKGFAVDYLAEYLDYLGIQNYLVEVGGEVRTKGLKKSGHPWKIGIEMPSMGRSVMKVVAPNGRAVATSGDYRNYFESEGQRYSHILDPRTGRPIKHRLASVSVLAETCAEADAYATAFMVMGLEASKEFLQNQRKQVRNKSNLWVTIH